MRSPDRLREVIPVCWWAGWHLGCLMIKHLLMSATALTATLLAVGTAANAQEAGGSEPAATNTVNEVVVTGSRIRTSPLAKTQAVVEVDQAAIQKTGLSSTADVLQRL